MPEYVVEFVGAVPSKKNSLSPRKGGGKLGYFNGKTRALMDSLAAQVPPEIRGLKLEHPEVTYKFFLPPNEKAFRPWQTDWDSKIAVLQDLLVKYGIFTDDCFSHHNGRKVIEPAVELPKGEVERTEVTIKWND